VRRGGGWKRGTVGQSRSCGAPVLDPTWESAGLKCLALLDYLKAYDSVGEARASIGRYLDFFNRKRPHSSLDARTPDRAYLDHLPQVAAA
jgi:transposase InsO family protein